jgi:ferrous iron transport protein A
MKNYFDNSSDSPGVELSADCLQPGQNAVVVGVECGDAVLRDKLHAMGLVPGTAVQLLRKAPLGGPVTLRIFSTAVALRLSEARCLKLSLA